MEKNYDVAGATLLLEEVFESLARVVRTPRSHRCRPRRGILNRRSILLDRHPEFIERTVVLRVLLRDAYQNRLRALKLPPGVEIRTLFAAMQRRLASWTFAVRIESGHQSRAATGATPAHHRPHHARSPRPHRVLLGPWLAARRPVRSIRSVPLFVLRIAVAVTALPILSFHGASCRFLIFSAGNAWLNSCQTARRSPCPARSRAQAKFICRAD